MDTADEPGPTRPETFIGGESATGWVSEWAQARWRELRRHAGGSAEHLERIDPVRSRNIGKFCVQPVA